MNSIDYSPFIEYILDELGLNYSARQGKSEGYYICQSPLSDDINPSFQIFVESGWCHSYNTMINNKERIHLKEVARLTGFLSEYIKFICDQHKIPTYKINKYKELIMKKHLGEFYDYKAYNECIDIFGKLWISQSDLLSTNEIKPFEKSKVGKVKSKKKKTKIVEVEQTPNQYQECLDYIHSRGLEFVDGRLEAVTLRINSFTTTAIALRYPCGFTRYRLIESKMRYISNGTMKSMYEIINNSNNKVILSEGEIDTLSIKDYVENFDLYSIGNCNSIQGLDILNKYDKIIILLDYDVFKKLKESIEKKIKDMYPNKDLIVTYKINNEDKMVDFNSLLKDNKKKLKERVDKICKL